MKKKKLEINWIEKTSDDAVKELEDDFYDVEYIKYPTFDGLEIAATLGIPKLEPGKKYPALVDVHGGPTGQYYRNFNIFAQVFAHHGFVILQPNFRGSTGYGNYAAIGKGSTNGGIPD